MIPLVTYELRDRVALVRLNRPGSLNALTAQLVDDLAAALERTSADEVGAAVLSGEGRAFCAGHDLNEVQDPAAVEANRRDLERVQDVSRLIRRSPHPVIAAVHGYALGAGFEFALGCDLVIAATGTRFGFPEVEVGLSVTGGVTALLPRAIGLARAKQLVLLGGQFSEERALEWGLVNEVVDDVELMPRALAVAQQVAVLPAASLRGAKAALDSGADAALDVAMQNEIELALALLQADQGPTGADRFRARSALPRVPPAR